MATYPESATSSNISITPVPIPIQTDYIAGRVTPSEVVGSIGENTGPTTGQVTPRT